MPAHHNVWYLIFIFANAELGKGDNAVKNAHDQCMMLNSIEADNLLRNGHHWTQSLSNYSKSSLDIKSSVYRELEKFLLTRIPSIKQRSGTPSWPLSWEKSGKSGHLSHLEQKIASLNLRDKTAFLVVVT